MFQHKDTNLEELEKEKMKYHNAGFKVAIFDDSQADGDPVEFFGYWLKKCGYDIPYDILKGMLENLKNKKKIIKK